MLEYPWQRIEPDSIEIADGIVVLSGGRHFPPSSGRQIIEWEDPDRFIGGIELFKEGKSDKLIFTGGSNPLFPNIPPEGEIYIKEAVSLGIPSENLFTTYPVFNTLQEAYAVNKLLKEKIPNKRKRIILVTSAFHMNRAKKVFERQGIIVQPYPVDFKINKNLKSSKVNIINFFPSAASLNKSSLAIREIIGRIIYRAF